MSLKVSLCQWNILVFTTMIILMDLANCYNVRPTNTPEIATMVTKLPAMLNLVTHGQLKNTKCTTVSDFETKTLHCLKDVYREKWILYIFKYKRENSMFMDLLKQITCSQYRSALQCVHDIWTACKSEETTSIVQDYLSRKVPLQYNALCDINQHGNHGNTSIQTQQHQHQDDKNLKPLKVHFSEKLTYKWETEVTIPVTDLKDKTEDGEDKEKLEELDKDSKIIQDLTNWKTNIGNLLEENYFNKDNISESLKYVHTKIRDSDKVKFKSTLQYRLSKKQV